MINNENTALIYSKTFHESETIIYSITTPVYNQEDIIVENIKSIIENTVENFELLIILDFCFDNTEKNILEYLDNYKNDVKNFIKIQVFKNKNKPLL